MNFDDESNLNKIFESLTIKLRNNRRRNLEKEKKYIFRSQPEQRTMINYTLQFFYTKW